ncbi:hypothetical protein SLS60_009914 [Paraconiothyrium brasiliense]|uniref:Alpha/beta hydrolase fold-3 domain-containing protein n=1 Tax=Paraconiothyrium brasiliense TaxID=300254 RepID=A0ABR3QSV2_9PLEO
MSDIHGGAWIGGYPEHTARWCSYLASRTGAVVVSISYRFAPLHAYPAAHDDVDDIVTYLIHHAPNLGADSALLTFSGSSAGGNMALSASQFLHSRAYLSSRDDERAKISRGYVGFCPVLNLRLKPEEKPKPPSFPSRDPLSWMMPLYDSYAGPTRERDWNDTRLNTLVAERSKLPKDMLFVMAGIDILAHEQLFFVERLKGEPEVGGDLEGSVEARVWDKGFHGWLECKWTDEFPIYHPDKTAVPKCVLEKERMEAFDMAVDFIRRVHRKHGFEISEY